MKFAQIQNIAFLVLAALSSPFSAFADEGNSCEKFIYKNNKHVVLEIKIPKQVSQWATNSIKTTTFEIRKITPTMESINMSELQPFVTQLSPDTFIAPERETVTQQMYPSTEYVSIRTESLIPGIQFSFNLEKNFCRCRTAYTGKTSEFEMKCQMKDADGNLINP